MSPHWINHYMGDRSMILDNTKRVTLENANIGGWATNHKSMFNSAALHTEVFGDMLEKTEYCCMASAVSFFWPQLLS